MSTQRLIIQNSILNLTANVSERMSLTAIFIIIARYLSADSAGSFRLATSYASILLALSLWGLDQLLIRDVVKNRAAAKQFLANFMVMRLIIALVAWLILAAVLPVLPYQQESKLLILILAATAVPGSLGNLYHAVWVADENVASVSVVMVIFSIFRVIGAGLILFQAGPLLLVAIMLLVFSIFQTVILGWLTHRRPDLLGLRSQLSRTFWVANLRVAAPFILISLTLLVEYQFDVVILSLFWPEKEVGIYGASATVLALLLFLTRSYQMAVFPVISRAFEAGEAAIQRVYSNSLAYTAIGAFLIALLITLLADVIISFIYGPGYEPAGDMLRILGWAFLFSAINVSNSRLLIAANKQRVMASFGLLSLVASLLISFLLVPRYGRLGTAIASFGSMPLYTIPALWYVQRNISRFSLRDWQIPGIFK